jgi:hypothetical protein
VTVGATEFVNYFGDGFLNVTRYIRRGFPMPHFLRHAEAPSLIQRSFARLPLVSLSNT